MMMVLLMMLMVNFMNHKRYTRHEGMLRTFRLAMESIRFCFKEQRRQQQFANLMIQELLTGFAACSGECCGECFG